MAKKKLPPSLRKTKKGKRLRRGTQKLHKSVRKLTKGKNRTTTKRVKATIKKFTKAKLP